MPRLHLQLKGKKTAKSAVKGKKKAKSSALTAEKAKALLKKKGITPDKYESAFQAAVTTPEEYGHFSLLLAAGVDASKPRTWEKLPELAGEYLSDAAKEQLKQEYTPLTVALLLSNERVARKLIALPWISRFRTNTPRPLTCSAKPVPKPKQSSEMSSLSDSYVSPTIRIRVNTNSLTPRVPNIWDT